MNILMVHPHDIYSRGEPWTVRILYIAKEFVKKGHRVKLVYFPLLWQAHKQQESLEGVITIPLPRMHGPHIFLSNIRTLSKLARWSDIVHFQKCFYHAAIPAIVAACLYRKPLHYDWDDWEVKIYEVSTQESPLRNLVKYFLNILERTIPKVADSVSVASSRLRLECEKLGVGRDIIFDAHVGADITKFHPQVSGESVRKEYGLKKPLVLYLGQLHGGQYAELFVKTAARITSEYQKDFSFMIVGDGYLAEELKKTAQRLNLNGKLIFAGAVPHEVVPQYISCADVCVACFEENEVTKCKSPLKIVEYMASGKAIVASNVGEVPGMIGEAGILTPAGDIDALARGIIELIENSRLRRNVEALARRRAEKEYNWTVTAENLLHAYKKSLYS